MNNNITFLFLFSQICSTNFLLCPINAVCITDVLSLILSQQSFLLLEGVYICLYTNLKDNENYDENDFVNLKNQFRISQSRTNKEYGLKLISFCLS